MGLIFEPVLFHSSVKDGTEDCKTENHIKEVVLIRQFSAFPHVNSIFGESLSASSILSGRRSIP